MAGKSQETAIFDLHFRVNPFLGEYTILAGVEECVRLLQSFGFQPDDIAYLRTVMPATTDPAFFDYLASIVSTCLTSDNTPNPAQTDAKLITCPQDASDVTLFACREGSVVFPREPLLRVEGPLPVVQLLETPFLTLINYASLVATNATRFCIAAGDKEMLEFGLRRAQVGFLVFGLNKHALFSPIVCLSGPRRRPQRQPVLLPGRIHRDQQSDGRQDLWHSCGWHARPCLCLRVYGEMDRVWTLPLPRLSRLSPHPDMQTEDKLACITLPYNDDSGRVCEDFPALVCCT